MLSICSCLSSAAAWRRQGWRAADAAYSAIPRGLLQVGAIVDDLVVLEQVLRTDLAVTGSEPAPGSICEKGVWKCGFFEQPKERVWSWDSLQLLGHWCWWRQRTDESQPKTVVALHGDNLPDLHLRFVYHWPPARHHRHVGFPSWCPPLTLQCFGCCFWAPHDGLFCAFLEPSRPSSRVWLFWAPWHLRAGFASFVSATDSSNAVMTAVRVSILPKVVQEVARHTLRKGIWTKLLAPSRAFLRMHWLLDAEEETPEEGYRSHPLWEALALLSGRGLRTCWSPNYGWILMNIRRMIALRCFKSMGAAGAAPICSSFSVAVTPPVRSSKYPRGLPDLRRSMQQKVRDGNSHSDFTRSIRPCLFSLLRRESRHFMVVAATKVEAMEVKSLWCLTYRCCFCRFGTAWCKANRFATNSRLAGVRMMCRCKKPHQRLERWTPNQTNSPDVGGTAVPTWTWQAVSNSLVSVSWLVSFRTS